MLRFAGRSLRGARTRTLLMLLAMSMGVASVMLLTALGEGARRFVQGEFSRLGTHLLIVLPGRAETTGGAPPLFGETPRDLTLQDALALERIDGVRAVAPISVGSAPVSHANREREVTILGSTAALFPVREISVASGSPLPDHDPERSAPLVVLGRTLKRELFGTDSALGKWVRISDRRFRVIGVLADQGTSLGQRMDDVAIIPVAAAQQVFDTYSLFRILVQGSSRDVIPRVQRRIGEVIELRHDGEQDVTIITQDALLGTFDRILRALTVAVGGIAAISLLVAGILIMNVMLVAVSQRTAEVGLMMAVGTPRRQILRLFLVESLLLAGAGALTGLLLSWSGLALLNFLLPNFPVAAPWWAMPAAVLLALGAGLVFGLQPARRAAALDPVQALRGGRR